MTPRLLSLLAAAAVLAGCLQKNAASIQASAICTIPDDCKFAESCSAQYIGPITVDVAGAPELNLAVEVDNNLAKNASEDTGHVNTNDADVRTAAMTYSTTGFTLTPRSQSLSNYVQAESSTVVWFNPLPPEAMLEIRTAGVVGAYNPLDPTTLVHLIATVTLSGNLYDGSTFEIAPKPIPITLCNGCLSVPTCTAPKVPGACGGAYQEPSGAASCVDAGTLPTTYYIGGSVTGLTSTGLQVTCGNAGTQTINTDGNATQTFVLPNGVVDGTAFDCIIDTTQMNPVQNCTFQNSSGTGTVNAADVTSLDILCT